MASASIDVAYARTWATIFKVGTHEGERYFGWYFCSPMLECPAGVSFFFVASSSPPTRRARRITKRGYAAIYKEGSSASDAFVRETRRILQDAGLLDYGDFHRVRQQKCDYTW